MVSATGDCEVAVIADWDADGVVGAALLYYAQEKRGVFPLDRKAKVCLYPSGPRSILEVVQDKCWPVVVLIDIPLTPEVEQAIALLKEKCGSKIYYFDHHSSTLKSVADLEEKYGVFAVVGRSPSSVLLKRFLEGTGLRFTHRLKDFVNAVAVLEGGRKGQELLQTAQVSEKLVSLAASISKMLNQTRNAEAWRKYVRWIANPLPFEDPGIRLTPEGDKVNLVEVGVEVSKQADAEVKEAALTLAMSAKNLGFIKFVDARGKWKKRGGSALASAIYKIVNMPVAVLFEKVDGSRLIVIRSGRGEAAGIIDELYEMGVVVDKGGHGNIAVARLDDSVTVKRLEDALRRAAFEASRKKRKPSLH